MPPTSTSSQLDAALSERLELRDVIDGTLRLLAERPGMSRPYLALTDSSTGRIWIEESHGLTEDQKRGNGYQFGDGIVARVIQRGRVRVVHGKSPGFLNRLDREELDRISFICAPVRGRDGDVLGAVAVDRLGGDQAELQADVVLVEAVADMLGGAIAMRRHVVESRKRIETENERLRAELRERFEIDNIVGSDKSMQLVFDKVARVAPTDTTVLLRGESGTGKELIARAIHFASPRANAPFVALNCAALAESTLESELFGHERGAFTGAVATHKGRFELANGGTIFLDEIGELRPQTQVKLLRVLQERTFERVGGSQTLACDVRVLAATHADLEAAIAQGTFRQDLFYRLNVFEISLPALRDRPQDILQLADHFVQRYGAAKDPPVTRISRKAARLLRAHEWPGNVRELENCIQRAVLLASEDVIRVEHLPPSVQGVELDVGGPAGAKLPPATLPTGTLDEALEDLEKRMLAAALDRTEGNRAAAARELGISERRMGLRVKRYGLG